MKDICWAQTEHPFISFTQQLVEGEIRLLADYMHRDFGVIEIEVTERYDGDCIPDTTEGRIQLGLPFLCYLWSVCTNIHAFVYGYDTQNYRLLQIYKYAVLSVIAHELGHRERGHGKADLQGEKDADDFAFEYLSKHESEFVFVGTFAQLTSLLLLDIMLHRKLDKVYDNHPPTLERIERWFELRTPANEGEKKSVQYAFGVLERFKRTKLMECEINYSHIVENIDREQKYTDDGLDQLCDSQLIN